MPIFYFSVFLFSESVIFESSSFFVNHTALPTPDEVRHAATAGAHLQIPHVDPSTWCVVRFPSLRLIVKYGRQITMAEGQCLWAVRTLLGNTVPVPELYGWYRDGESTFLYMELIQAPTLKERWSTLSTSEKEEIGTQFGQVVNNIGQLELHPSLSEFVGHIGGQPIQDVIFINSYPPHPGPFPSVSSFHNYFATLRRPLNHSTEAEDHEPHPYRSLLPDSCAIKFTHGDLHLTNILVSPEGTGPARIVAIIDWHQSGWFPEYWEYCKAVFTVYSEEWENYVHRAIEEPEGYVGFEWFSLAHI